MNGYISKHKYKRVTFMESSIALALSSALEWMREPNKHTGKPNSDYVVDIVSHYDGVFHILYVYYEAK